MIRIGPILFFLALLCVPAWARAPQTYAEQERYCAYGENGSLVSFSDRSKPCDVPEQDQSLLFWNLILAAGVLVLIGRELTKRRA